MATKYIKLTQPQRARLPKLLHMEYTVTELARELGCGRAQIRRALEAGCPHRRTEAGRVWVVGDAFADWYVAMRKARKTTLGPNEAWCVGCRCAVPLPEDAEVVVQRDGVRRVTGRCPICGAGINRYRRSE